MRNLQELGRLWVDSGSRQMREGVCAGGAGSRGAGAAWRRVRREAALRGELLGPREGAQVFNWCEYRL